jgi:hypothetical protein
MTKNDLALEWGSRPSAINQKPVVIAEKESVIRALCRKATQQAAIASPAISSVSNPNKILL